ncbi:hypothetical protein JHK87_043879 [Glycine soja]|nr:hypothetical protein JHK87_043879 [Glycine soja]
MSPWPSIRVGQQDLSELDEVQVLCGVNHEDLKELFHVSKTIREATMITKELHFDIKTPKKKKIAFLNTFDLEGAKGFKEKEALNGQLKKTKSRLHRKKLDNNIWQALFAFMDEEEPRKDNCHRRRRTTEDNDY